MNLKPGAENRQKREWLRREARSASAKEGSLAPFRQFFATSPVTCPYIAGRAERKLIVLCSDTVLNAVPTDRRTLLEAMMLKEFRQYCGDGHLRRSWTSAEGGELKLHIQWKGF